MSAKVYLKYATLRHKLNNGKYQDTDIEICVELNIIPEVAIKECNAVRVHLVSNLEAVKEEIKRLEEDLSRYLTELDTNRQKLLEWLFNNEYIVNEHYIT